MDLPRGHSVLAVSHKPNDRQPLIQSERRVLKNRPGLKAELTFRMVTSTLPPPRLRIVLNLGTAASRTEYSRRPALRNHVSNPVIRIGKMRDSLSQSSRGIGIHESSVAQKLWTRQVYFYHTFQRSRRHDRVEGNGHLKRVPAEP